MVVLHKICIQLRLCLLELVHHDCLYSLMLLLQYTYDILYIGCQYVTLMLQLVLLPLVLLLLGDGHIINALCQYPHLDIDCNTLIPVIAYIV